MAEGGGSLDVRKPVNPVTREIASRVLTGEPFLVKVDRYGSVSGLVRVRVPLGVLVINTERIEVPSCGS